MQYLMTKMSYVSRIIRTAKLPMDSSEIFSRPDGGGRSPHNKLYFVDT